MLRSHPLYCPLVWFSLQTAIKSFLSNFQNAMTQTNLRSTDEDHNSLEALEMICFKDNTKDPLKYVPCNLH